MSLPLVSIILNVYNGELYLGECLESILALGEDISFEILIIDDDSTDSSGVIVQSYSDPRISYVKLAKNLGAAAAINHAFNLVRGEFVARIDYDDRYRPNFLIESLNALRRHPAAAFVCASIQMIDPLGRPAGKAGPADYGEEVGCRDRFQSILTRHFVSAPTILGRAALWRRGLPIPAGMNFCDWYMNLSMAEAAPVVVLDSTTADYRIHPLNMHTTQVRDGMGERVTLEVLDRFLVRSPRAAELAPHANEIRGGHFADWGDRYFGAGMDADAMRCYLRALRTSPRHAIRSGWVRRALGLAIGRKRYEWAKSHLIPRNLC